MEIIIILIFILIKADGLISVCLLNKIYAKGPDTDFSRHFKDRKYFRKSIGDYCSDKKTPEGFNPPEPLLEY